MVGLEWSVVHSVGRCSLGFLESTDSTPLMGRDNNECYNICHSLRQALYCAFTPKVPRARPCLQHSNPRRRLISRLMSTVSPTEFLNSN
ncbi:hypothetical protein BJY04DRAFT_203951 [Aspergillus karnatakaensis]|uniref:uncharacterized protein n=1 Tax=Aspergillus karnatakaensis TaxID=1810916 RepID=UPI003CCD646C